MSEEHVSGTRLFAASCLHLGGTGSYRVRLERVLEELGQLPNDHCLILLGDIADPSREGVEQVHELVIHLDKNRTWFIPGNNDWWMPRVTETPVLWAHYREMPFYLPDWAWGFEGGNYQNLPWSHHHDMLTLEQEEQWAQMLTLECDSDVQVLCSHFPFVHFDGERGGMARCWTDALLQTNVRKLVFGHLHPDYLDQIPDEYHSRKIQVVSDHRECVFHEIVRP